MMKLYLEIVDWDVDPSAENYDDSALYDDGSCTYLCIGTVTLTLFDSWGDTWNGGTIMIDSVVYDQPSLYDGFLWGEASDSYDVS